MTITLLMPDGVAVTAQQERQAGAAQHGGGSGRPLGGRSGFRVDTPSTILTATSTTWTLLPCSAELDPGASTHQGMYGWASDSTVSRAEVVAADATYARKDIVYIQVNDSSAGDGSSGTPSAPLVYLAGTPSATPTAPDLPNVRCFLVGTISVPIAGGGSPTVVLNPARYVAAGAPLPIESQTAQDALTKYPASEIVRTDDRYKKYISDGTKWMPHADALGLMAEAVSNTSDATGQVAIVVLQNIASFPFLGGRRYRIKFRGNYYTNNLDTVVLFKIGHCATADAAGLTTGITVLDQTDFQATSTSRGFPADFEARYNPTSDTTRQLKITAERVSGTGSFALQRGPTTPNWFYIEDLGAQF